MIPLTAVIKEAQLWEPPCIIYSSHCCNKIYGKINLKMIGSIMFGGGVQPIITEKEQRQGYVATGFIVPSQEAERNEHWSLVHLFLFYHFI